MPELIIEKTTPEEQVLLGATVPWTIKVTNTGNFAAHDVVVTDTLPKGLTHASGNRSITSEVGTLSPGESRELTVMTTASERGRYCNQVSVASSNANSAEEEACVQVANVGLEVRKKGTERWELMRKWAGYTPGSLHQEK